jgi:hypothetical protein
MYVLANLYPTSYQPLVMDAETVSEGMEFNDSDAAGRRRRLLGLVTL